MERVCSLADYYNKRNITCEAYPVLRRCKEAEPTHPGVIYLDSVVPDLC